MWYIYVDFVRLFSYVMCSSVFWAIKVEEDVLFIAVKKIGTKITVDY